MPLQHGSSAAARSANIAELIRSGHPPKQAEAAAYRMSGEGRKDADPHGIHDYHDACSRGDVSAQLAHKFGGK